jgi:uncharacterized protein YegL
MSLHPLNKRKYGNITVILLLLSYLCSVKCRAQDSDNFHSVLLLIDVSGSMNGIKMDSVKSAAKQIVKMLLPCNTEFSVMGFSGKKENPIPFRFDFSSNQSDLLSFIDKLKPEGGTPLGAALKTASLYFTAHKVGVPSKQSIILLSDGRSDDNVLAVLKELKERNALVPCECIGYEIENDKIAGEQLKQIAHETGGEYYVATDVSNIIKAFLKTSIKAIIHDIPVVVRKGSVKLNFKLNTGNIYKTLTSLNWILDSVQINVSPGLYDMAQFVTNENMQDTLPKSIVFDDYKKLSLFINKGTDTDVNKKWIEGNYVFNKDALSITVKQYYFKLIIRFIDNNSLVLCVNKFKNLSENPGENNEDICDCSNKITENNPYILIYFSVAGCNH